MFINWICFVSFASRQKKVKDKISFTILLAPKVSKTVLFFGRIFLFSADISPPNKTADSKIPRSAHSRPSIFSQLYLRKIKIRALKSLWVGLRTMLFRLVLWHFKMLYQDKKFYKRLELLFLLLQGKRNYFLQVLIMLQSIANTKT